MMEQQAIFQMNLFKLLELFIIKYAVQVRSRQIGHFWQKPLSIPFTFDPNSLFFGYLGCKNEKSSLFDKFACTGRVSEKTHNFTFFCDFLDIESKF